MGNCPYFSCGDERGVALLMALAVLVLMAILAVSFYMSESIEREGADNSRYARSAEALAESGLNWAMDLLARDVPDDNGTPAYDTDYDIWARWAKRSPNAYAGNADLLFSNNRDDDAVDLSPLFGTGNDAQSYDSRWILIHDGDRVIGRLAVLVEDECGKVNLNAAGDANWTLYNGLGPAEVALNWVLNEINSSLADTEAAQIIELRYGDDKKPGIAGNDDDNDGPLGYRLCDDNLNGVIDETGDAVDEPDEHDPYSIAGDDIVFDDLTTILLAPNIDAYRGDGSDADKVEKFNDLLAYLTVNSRTQGIYKVKPADNADNAWAPMLALDGSANASTIRQRLQELQDAGRLPKKWASDDDVDLDQIAANIADFIDEDNVPTQLGSKHGVERTPYLNEIEANRDIAMGTAGMWHDTASSSS